MGQIVDELRNWIALGDSHPASSESSHRPERGSERKGTGSLADFPPDVRWQVGAYES